MNINVPETKQRRIVIVGGGFGGIELAKQLDEEPFQVVMIDENNYHTFQPLLYQVATAGLEPDSIAFPLRKIFKKQENFIFRMACVKQIYPEQNKIETSIGELSYDYLVLATGSDTNFFGNKNVEEHSMPMKNIVEALNLRSLILQNFEQALLTVDPLEKERIMNIVIVGGGPTGVETAGALAELRNHILPKDFPELDISKMQIHLVEAGTQLLNSFSDEGSKKTHDFLTNMGVKIWFDTRVEDYDGFTVKSNKASFHTKTLIWAAGVAGAVVNGVNASAIARGNRYIVDQTNKVKGYDNIFAIGDVAAMVTEANPTGHPMVAPVAIQQAKHLGKNFVRLIHKQNLLPFEYKDKGSMATVGRNKAIVDIGSYKTQGFFAWVMWMFVHLLMLVGFRNKVVVFINWLWSYILYDRGIRLIIRPFKRKTDEMYQLKKVS